MVVENVEKSKAWLYNGTKALESTPGRTIICGTPLLTCE
jgi:hypothetical protein